MNVASTNHVSRRGLLIAGVVGGLSLAGCGGSTTQHEPDTNSNRGGPEQGGRTPMPGAAGPGLIGETTDVPVGGGRVYPDHNVVVTQPTANDFRGFQATCTYGKCTVSKVENGLIACPCHGCRFSAVDGSVRHGPATKPLPSANVTIEGTEIRLLD
jgi:Rieske Fe-S protein